MSKRNTLNISQRIFAGTDLFAGDRLLVAGGRGGGRRRRHRCLATFANGAVAVAAGGRL